MDSVGYTGYPAVFFEKILQITLDHADNVIVFISSERSTR